MTFLVKPKLLFLVHRIPYPPNKGDKIRSFQLLKFLSERYDVYLGCFIDDPDDWQYFHTVKAYCQDVCVLALNGKLAKLKSLKGLLQAKPLTEPYYFNAELAQWVKRVVAEQKIEHVVVFSSSMAQYVEDDAFNGLRRVIDFVDLDSDKWAQYSLSKSGLMRWIYQREAKMLFEWEKRIAEKFDYAAFVSDKEAEFFKSKAPAVSNKVGHFNNGVDFDYFDPALDFPNPYIGDDKIIVFTGAMDYWANVDAVVWFSQEYFPLIRAKLKHVKFYIVGGNPTDAVKRLAKIDGVVVTGKVTDIRPYLRHADVSVAPLRIARGIQNKVLEAMAMSKICVLSPQAFEGIHAQDGQDLLTVQEPGLWVETIIAALSNDYQAIEQSARQCIVRYYSWKTNLDVFSKHIV